MLSGNPSAQNGHARRRLFSQGRRKTAGSGCPKGGGGEERAGTGRIGREVPFRSGRE